MNMSRKRQALVEGGLEAFLSQGYHAASLDRIAEAAGVARRTIYNHFSSKEELFKEIVRSIVDQALGPIPTGYGEGSTSRAFLRSFMVRYAGLMLADPQIRLHRLVLAEVGRFPLIGRLYAEGYARTRDGIADKLKKLAARGELSISDPTEAADRLWQLAITESHNKLLFDPTLRISEKVIASKVEAAVDCFLRLYGLGDQRQSDSQKRKKPRIASGM
jgi:TetR/AcrR family transcriptional regulator, mexJK operon transcriptional repressor